MNSSLRLAVLPLAVSGVLLVSTNLLLAQGELSPRPVWKKWQRDISQFHAELRQVVREAKIPEKESLKKRFEEKSSGLEVVTDGYGGVVDFDAAEGTIQSLANERFADMNIEWEFELANDTEIYWNKSTKLIPKIPRTAKDGKQDNEQPLIAIRIAKTDTGPFHSGDRVRLKASIDDFSRFRKDYSRAFGLVAIYYLEEGPNPVFDLRLDEAEVTLIKGAKKDAGKSKPAKSEATQDKVAGENGRNALEQLLETADKERLTYSPDKKLLAHLEGHLVTVWSVEERRQLHQFVLEGKSLAVAAFSPAGESLVTADVEGNLEYRATVKLWSLASGEGRSIAEILGVPTDFSFSPDGSRLAATSNLNLIGSLSKNPAVRSPKDRIASDRIQTGGSIHVWQVSNGDELLKVDIELPEYTAQLKQIRLELAVWSDRKKARNALEAAYAEAVRKRVPYRLNFSPDGERLIGVSESGQETIFDATTAKPLRPKSRGEQERDDHPATALKSKSGGKAALGNVKTPESQEAGKGTITPTGLTIVVCDSANNVLDTLVVARDIKKGHFDFIVPEDIDEIRVFAMGNRIVGIGGTGGISNPWFEKEISETLTKNYFVARSEARGGMDFVAAEIEEGVLSGISAGEAPRSLKVTGEMRRQIRADIAAGKRAPIIYRHEDDESGRGGFRRVLVD